MTLDLDPRNIDPTRINIDGKAYDADECVAVAENQLHGFAQAKRYWRPLLERGRTLTNRYEGKILTEKQRAYYESVEDKIVMQPPIAKPLVRALVGQVIKARRSGQVVTERDAEATDNSEELKIVNAVLKYMETKTREQYLIADAVSSAFTCCYWNVLMYDLDRPSRNSEGLRFKLRHLPWDSCLFAPPTAREPDGSDIRELYFFDRRSIGELIDNFPDMEKQIEAHFAAKDYKDSKLLASIDQWSNTLSSDERNELWSVVQGDRSSGAGQIEVVMHLYPVKKRQEVWVNLEDESGGDFEIRPPEWTDEQWYRWTNDEKNIQKYAGPYEKEVIVLWQTVFTTSGLVLSHGEHWFQENGMLPCSFWLGDVSDNQPTGVMVDISDEVLANCVAQIELLDEMRKGNGRLLLAREGGLTDKSLENLHAEANKAFGVAFVRHDFRGSMNDAVTEMVRKPNSAWEGWAQGRRDSMVEITRVNEAMTGAHSPRQSAIAKEAEIAQALTVNARYIDNHNRSWDYHQNLKLKLIAYFFKGHEVIEIQDDDVDMEAGTPEVQKVEINAPAGYDAFGNVTAVVNNLTAHRYRWRTNPVDDSPIAKIRTLEEAMVFLNGVAGPLMQADPSGTLFTELMASTSNPMLMKAARKMAEQAQSSSQAAQQAQQTEAQLDAIVKLGKLKADLERASKQNSIINWRAVDLADYPMLAEIWGQLQIKADETADANFAEVIQGAQLLTQPAQQLPEMGSDAAIDPSMVGESAGQFEENIMVG